LCSDLYASPGTAHGMHENEQVNKAGIHFRHQARAARSVRCTASSSFTLAEGNATLTPTIFVKKKVGDDHLKINLNESKTLLLY
jgi:hypothetical protein